MTSAGRKKIPSRRGEKVGWIGGWSGGFVWVIILAAVFLFQGRTIQGVVGIAVACVALGAIFYFAPWRHPETRFRVLMLPVYAAFLAAVAWAIWAMEDPSYVGISGWSSSPLLLPLLLPLFLSGRRRWIDGGV